MQNKEGKGWALFGVQGGRGLIVGGFSVVLKIILANMVGG